MTEKQHLPLNDSQSSQLVILYAEGSYNISSFVACHSAKALNKAKIKHNPLPDKLDGLQLKWKVSC